LASVLRGCKLCNKQATQAFQYLEGHAQLDEPIVGIGNGLKEVGNDGGTLHCFANKQHKLSYTWDATSSSISPLLGLATASKRSAMMYEKMQSFCNNQAT
jgi:hypothetical protein